jgi:hypothetical protein
LPYGSRQTVPALPCSPGASDGRPAAGGSHQPQQVLICRCAAQQVLQFLSAQPLHVPGVLRARQHADDRRVAERAPVRDVVGHRRVPPTVHEITRSPAGGPAGSSPAMLCDRAPAVTPRYPSLVASGSAAGSDCPSRDARCSTRTWLNASRVSCAASRAVMKNDTIRTRPVISAEGRSTKEDSSADFPVRPRRAPAPPQARPAHRQELAPRLAAFALAG